jgi:hypothetical protein
MVMMEDFYAEKDGDMVSVIAGVSNLIRPASNLRHPEFITPISIFPHRRGKKFKRYSRQRPCIAVKSKKRLRNQGRKSYFTAETRVHRDWSFS